MRHGPPARTTKAKARIGRFHELVAAAPKPPASELALAIPPGPRLGAKVLQLERVEKCFGARVLFQDLELELTPGERLNMVGPNGASKTTLLKLYLNELEPDAGRVVRGETAVFA